MANEKRTIDRFKTMRLLRDLKVPETGAFSKGINKGLNIALSALGNAEIVPTVDAVEVVHGQWIGTQYDGYADGCPVYDLWECSNCREEYESEGDPPPFNYCPHCGAKMDVEVSNGEA